MKNAKGRTVQPPRPDLFSFDRIQLSIDLPHLHKPDTHRRKARKKPRIRSLSQSATALFTPLPFFAVVPPEQSGAMQDSLCLLHDWTLLEEDMQKAWRVLINAHAVTPSMASRAKSARSPR